MTLATVPRYDAGQLSIVGERAIVVGAGMAGLLSARVLADAFEEVLLLERDPFPDEPTDRRGTPQAAHAHAMLEAGRATIEDLFPGYGEAVRAAGGITIDQATQFDYYHRGDFLVDGPEPLPMLCASRPLFEQVVRERIEAHERVTVRSACRFTDFLYDDAATAVTGVEIENETSAREELAADLVVDATGRSSRTPRWLERHDYPSPAVDEVRIDLAYSTTTVRRPPGDRYGFLIGPTPDLPRGGAVIPIEGDRWIVTLFGVHGDHPPTGEPAFREFAASLPTPKLERLLEANPMCSEEIHHYPFPSSRWRRYERLDRFPDGLVVTGDAVASFNPIYGQGMSVAALDALQLHHALAAGGRRDLARRFFDRVAETVGIIWRMTVSADFEFPQTSGPEPLGSGLSNRYFSRLIRTAHADEQVTDALGRVLRLERPPRHLLRPAVLCRVLLPMRLNTYL